MYRQGNGGIYDEALCLARPWGFPIDGVAVPVRIWHGARDRVVPVGMGRYIERTVPGAIATFYRNEGHHFVYDRWREILAVIVAEARSRTLGQVRAIPAGARSEATVLDRAGATRVRPPAAIPEGVRSLADSAPSG
jgi:hypothetical protein